MTNSQRKGFLTCLVSFNLFNLEPCIQLGCSKAWCMMEHGQWELFNTAYTQQHTQTMIDTSEGHMRFTHLKNQFWLLGWPIGSKIIQLSSQQPLERFNPGHRPGLLDIKSTRRAMKTQFRARVNRGVNMMSLAALSPYRYHDPKLQSPVAPPTFIGSCFYHPIQSTIYV